jgi:(S)-3,5-dihydroxyphenylglycine transaminase
VTSTPATPRRLSVADLHASLRDPALESMNFLNEVSSRYPDAISFAAGRPTEEFFDVEAIHRYLRRYQEHLTVDKGLGPAEVSRTLMQYGRTKGIIHDLVVANLRTDEGIDVDPEAIVVTIGAQEAIFLVLRALRTDERDVVLAIAPTYVGLTGAAQLVDLPVITVPGGPHGTDLHTLTAALEQARQAGYRPRACYLVPDFSNPSGISLDVATRQALLDLAEAQDILLLEDNPYGLFTAGTERAPTLKSMDARGRVIYLGTFAKTGMPGARVGFVVADQLVDDPTGVPRLLADELSKIKSMVTVNTSPIAQAVVAGRLLENRGSLVAANQNEIATYRANLATLLTGLARHFPARKTPGVHWNAPAGGFFLVLSVPFVADDECLEISARQYGVLWTPMRHFHQSPEARRQLRLAYSSPTGPEQIEEGLRRLAALVTDRTEPAAPVVA